MLAQIRRTAPPSVNATTTETGRVCPRNNVAVLTAINRGAETQLSRFSIWRWNSRLAAPQENTIMLTLNSTRTGLTLLPSFGRVCMIAQAQAIRIDSVALSMITDNNRNGRLTDMFPLMPGMVTFIRDVPTAATS